MEQHRFSHDPAQYKESHHNILRNPNFNKGTAFTHEEREKYRLRGLLPAAVESLEQQLNRAVRQLRSFDKPLDKYIYLQSLQDRNETLFYRLLMENLVETMPVVYTPTVGEACIKFDRIYRMNKGMYLNIAEDKGCIRKILDNWDNEPDIIVVTDGSRILGLGDLGANGMGIPIGKLSLYVAAAGFHPLRTLPVCLDVGTNNDELLNDQLYLGIRQKRERGPAFFEFAEEFLMAVKDKWPKTLVQFEDFSNDVCFELLEKYRNRLLCFNDDIQGTGAVVVAGWLNAVKLTKKAIQDMVVVIHGAGSAAVGVADQIVTAISMQTGMTEEQVRQKAFYLVDSKGLVTVHRGDQLQEHKVKYARHDVTDQVTHLIDVIRRFKPTCLIGLSGQGGAFGEEIITEMGKLNEKPIIFALSNPLKNSECTAEEAYKFTEGRAIFASGSPFAPVEYNGKLLIPGQGNNMYIFPGLGLGAVAALADKVTDTMIGAASSTLAHLTPAESLAEGKIYPDLNNIRQISLKIAQAVAEQAVKDGVSRRGPADYETIIKNSVYVPDYVLPYQSRGHIRSKL